MASRTPQEAPRRGRPRKDAVGWHALPVPQPRQPATLPNYAEHAGSHGSLIMQPWSHAAASSSTQEAPSITARVAVPLPTPMPSSPLQQLPPPPPPPFSPAVGPPHLSQLANAMADAPASTSAARIPSRQLQLLPIVPMKRTRADSGSISKMETTHQSTIDRGIGSKRSSSMWALGDRALAMGPDGQPAEAMVVSMREGRAKLRLLDWGSDHDKWCNTADLKIFPIEWMVVRTQCTTEGPGPHGVVLPVANVSLLAAALDRAQTACAALGAHDRLKPLMAGVLQSVVERLQPSEEQWAFGSASRSSRPALPDRWKYLNKLAASSTRRPARAAAYQAMDALLDVAFPIIHASATERKQKQRADATYRYHENELDAERKHQKRIAPLVAFCEDVEQDARLAKEKHERALADGSFWAERRALDAQLRAIYEAPARRKEARERQNVGLGKWQAKQRALALETERPTEARVITPEEDIRSDTESKGSRSESEADEGAWIDSQSAGSSTATLLAALDEHEQRADAAPRKECGKSLCGCGPSCRTWSDRWHEKVAAPMRERIQKEEAERQSTQIKREAESWARYGPYKCTRCAGPCSSWRCRCFYDTCRCLCDVCTERGVVGP